MRLCIGSAAVDSARIVRRLGAVLAFSLGTLAAGEARAQLPAAIAGLDAAPLVTLHAEGAQIYECKTDGDGKLNWAFREPVASLMRHGARSGATMRGRHGSIATAAALRPKSGTAPSATTADIPWLKLEVIERRGSGALAGADFVQRINTVGGVLRGACARAGTLRSVAYAADYVFRRKDR
jgi:hypothetical protein